MLQVSLRHALRSLLQDRRFSILAIVLLAATLGSVLAIYAMVDALLLRPFPFVDQDRLMVIWQRDDRRALPVVEIAHGEMEDWGARTRAFEELAVIGSVNWSAALAGPAETESVPMSAVSGSFFSVTGVQPALGRGFDAGEDQGMRPTVMVISHGLWLRRYGGESGVVGRAVPVQFVPGAPPEPVEVIGVMPATFDFPRGADVWMPAAPLMRRHHQGVEGIENALRWLRVFYGLGRLRPGVSLEEATRDLTQVMRTADVQDGPEPNEALVVTPVASYLIGPAGPVLWALFAGAVLMLSVACANVAGLQVSRAAHRQRALAIRVALGASGRQVAAQTLLESGMLALAAAAVAVGVAAATTRTLVWLAPAEVPRLDTVTLLNGPVLAAGAIASFLALIAAAAWPVLVAHRVDAVRVLAHGGSVAADPQGRRVQRAIVVAQVAVALTLLAGAALFLRTLQGLDRTTLGFDPDRLLAVNVTPDTSDRQRWNATFDRLIERVEALPDVAAAGAVRLRPLSGPIGLESQPVLYGQYPGDAKVWGLNPHMNLQTVSPGYFRAMGIRLVRGRLFARDDTETAPGVVIVSESTARRFWPGRDPIGERLGHYSYVGGSDPEPRWQTVVGVVEDVRYRGLNDVRLDCYMPTAQSTALVEQLMIRTRGDAAAAIASIRAAAREIDPTLPVSDATIMSDIVAAESAPWRFLLRIFVAFAITAAALAAIGLGAVIALAIAIRRRELAIRAALGANRAALRALVLREGYRLVGAGTAVGVLGALGLGTAVAHVLIDVSPYDPAALIAAGLVVTVVGLVASWLPSRRAADADPLEALRAE